jgi:hypothetical protein
VVVGRAWWEKGEGKFLGERKREREREREKWKVYFGGRERRLWKGETFIGGSLKKALRRLLRCELYQISNYNEIFFKKKKKKQM